MQLKLEQLASCAGIDTILVSTDDPEVRSIAESLSGPPGRPIRVEQRPKDLATSGASTDALISHVGELLRGYSPETGILWTHVTSPFFQAASYSRALTAYSEFCLGNYDSLMAVQPLRTFLVNRGGFLNRSGAGLRWPKTQDLDVVWAVTSAAFIAPLKVYWELGDRVGLRPYFFECDLLESLDIDWPADFELAERLWMALNPDTTA